MITYMALTLGLVARTLYAIGTDLTPKKLLWIGGCLLAGFYAVGRSLEDGDPSWVFLPLFYAAFVVFVFKRYFLQPITEGTLFVMGLLAAYVFVSELAVGLSDGAALFGFYFLIVYLTLSITLIATRFRSNKGMQVFYVLMFMILSIWLTYVVSVRLLTIAAPFWEVVTIGFAYLPFVANIFYILYFVPIPLSRRQSFRERLAEIREHAADLETHYYDVDVEYRVLLLNLLAVVTLCTAHFYSLISLPLLITLLLGMSSVVNRPPQLSVFTPRQVTQQW